MILYVAARRSDSVRQAAFYGVISGILFGVSACLVKPTLEALHDGGVSDVLSHWEFFGMAITGIVAFLVQQISLSAGYLATSVATVSVSNPIISVALGVLLFDERLSRPAWHVVVAVCGLALAMLGAVMISIAREKHRDPSRSRSSPAHKRCIRCPGERRRHRCVHHDPAHGARVGRDRRCPGIGEPLGGAVCSSGAGVPVAS